MHNNTHPALTPAELAHGLSRLRDRRHHTCARCGGEFEGLARAVYCGSRCRSAAWRAAHKKEISVLGRVEQAEQERRESPR